MVPPRSAARKKMQPPPSSWPPPLLQPDSVDPDKNFDTSAFSSDRQTKASSRRKDAGIQRSKGSDLSRDDSGTNRAGRLNMQNRIGKVEGVFICVGLLLKTDSNEVKIGCGGAESSL
ncbi:hypothetical protein LINGRAHAP2_LOCUS14661 [Linum grandiflorum]